MTLDIGKLVETFGLLGLIVAMVAGIWYVMLTPRTIDGQKRSALLTPGWLLDQERDEFSAEITRTRQFYEVALKDAQNAANTRIAEWRGFRDEAVAKAADADDDRRRLLEAVTSASRDIALLLELQRMAGRDSGKPGDSGRD